MVVQEQFVKAGTEFPPLSLRIHPGFPLQEAQSHNIQRKRTQYHHGLSGVVTRQPTFYLSRLLWLRVPEHISKMYLFFSRTILLHLVVPSVGAEEGVLCDCEKMTGDHKEPRGKLPTYHHFIFSESSKVFPLSVPWLTY